MSSILALVLVPLQVLAAPLDIHRQPRAIQSIGPIDPSTDEWSSTLSGIGPLILLLGERTTRQVLRNVRGISHAFSLAAAPLGLLTVATSLVRFCGTQKLRAFIGYELEARTVAGLEITRVNCGGVSAHLTDGYVVRSIVANPPSELLAVSILEGKEGDLANQAMATIRECDRFNAKKNRLGFPEGEANTEWCLHITIADLSAEAIDHVVRALADAVGLDSDSKEVIGFRQRLRPESLNEESSNVGFTEAITETPVRDSSTSFKAYLRPAATFSTTKSDDPKVSVLEVAPTVSTLQEKNRESPALWHFTFMTTFNAVSEFTNSAPVSSFSAATLGTLSCSGIVTVHLLALWHNNWVMSIGWILVMLGYIGIVFSVMSASLLIHSSCISIQMDTSSSSNSSKQWKHGMVISAKNSDSMDTTGSTFVTCPSPHRILEAVYIKPSISLNRCLASFVTFSLILAFVAHYLGLRAITWWASIGELGICILAAFARSVSNDMQPRFSPEKGVKIDKQCCSTGVIHTQTAHVIDNSIPQKHKLDARSYSLRTLLNNVPTVGERVAYQTARLCQNDPRICALLTEITDMHLHLTRKAPDTYSLLLSFSGGILVTEGLASPATSMLLSFQSTLSSLAAPTSLLGRAIMRQPQWRLQAGVAKGIPLGNVYVFAMQSVLDWWTLSEDRNDMDGLQRNFQWPLFLVNVTFFLRCFELEDGRLMQGLEEAHEAVGNEDLKVAGEVVEFLRGWKF